MKYIIEIKLQFSDLYKIAFLIFLLISFPLNAIFFYGRIWEKTDFNGEKHYLIGLGDYHIAHYQTKKQLVDLMSAIPSDSLLLVECTSDLIINKSLAEYPVAYQTKLNFVTEQKDWISLDDLVFLANKLKIPYKNLEFRLTNNVVGNCIKNNLKPKFGQSLNCIKNWCKENFEAINSFSREESEKVKKIYLAYEKAIVDVTILHNFYLFLDQALLVNSIDETKDFDENLCKQLLPKIYESAPEFFDLKYLANLYLTINCPILDALLLKEIISNEKNHRNIFICVGAGHLDAIGNSVEKLGYIPIFEKNFGNCIIDGSNPEMVIDVQAYLDPYFLKIRWIDQFGDPTLTDGATNNIYYGLCTIAAVSAFFLYAYRNLTLPEEFGSHQKSHVPKIPLQETRRKIFKFL